MGDDEPLTGGSRAPDYGSAAPVPPGVARVRAAAAAGHTRIPSHVLYSRRRRRTMRAAAGPDTKGDFVIHDFVNEKTRSHILRAQRKREDGGAAAYFWYNGQVYLVLLLLGLGAGAVAAYLDIVVDWLSDVKFGACSDGWFVSRDLCCHTAPSFEACPAWLPWAERFKGVTGIVWVSDALLDFVAFLTCAVGFAAIAAFLVKRYAPYAAGSGVPEIKTVLSGVELKGYLSLWAMTVKVVGLAFAVSSGLNLGKEGPFVHLVSALASVLGNCFQALSADFNVMQELITSGTAAGVSVAFNAPIGGVLFAFEEAATFFPNHVLWRSFLASAIAALTLKVMNPFFNGRAVIFEIDHGLEWFWFEMLPFAFIGVVGGLIGVVFIEFNVQWTKFRLHNDRMKRSPILEAVAIVVLTSFMSYFIDFYKLSNTEILATLFSECTNLTAKEEHNASVICGPLSDLRWSMYWILLYGAASKLFLTILTFGVRVPAGLFIPSMTIGACVGRIVGELTQVAYEKYPASYVFSECASSSVCVRPSIYALVGAASSLAGVTQVSVSLVVIMFELTGGLSHLLPTMIGILSAKFVCAVLGYDEGIYDNHINLKLYPYLGHHQHVGHAALTARTDTIMREPTAVIPQMGCTVGDLRRLLRQHSYYGFPIVTNSASMILTGNVVRSELNRALKQEADSNPRVTAATPVIFNGKLDPEEARALETLERDNGGLVLRFANYRDRYLSQMAPETPIADANYCFSELGVRMCFVTRHGKLLGVVSKKDIIAYNDVHDGVDEHFFHV